MNEIDELRKLLDNEALISSARILILISLNINEKMYFTDLLNLTGTGKGSLSNNLDILKKYGYIVDRMVFSLTGPRRLISITEKGQDFYDKYTNLISKFRSDDK